MSAATPGQADAYARVVEQLAKVRAIVFRSDTQQSRIRDLVELLDPALAAQEPHAADGKTPGQLAYEQVARARLMVFSGEQWADLTKQTRAAWEATAAVVETAQARLARADRDQLRKHVLDQAADLDISAAATRPSRKSDIESEIAIALRKIAEPPA